MGLKLPLLSTTTHDKKAATSLSGDDLSFLVIF